MSEENGKALSEEVTGITETIKTLNEQFDTLEDNMKSLNQTIRLEEQLRRGESSIFYRPALLEQNYFAGRGESGETSDKRSLLDILNTGIAGGGLGASIPLKKIPISKAGAAGVGAAVAIAVADEIHSIEQAADEAAKTLAAENLAFQTALGANLGKAYQSIEDTLTSGILLTAPYYMTANEKLAMRETQQQASMGNGYFAMDGINKTNQENFYEKNGGLLAEAQHSIGAYQAFQSGLPAQYKMEAESILLGNASSGLFTQEAVSAVYSLRENYKELTEQLRISRENAENTSVPEEKAQYMKEYALLGGQMEKLLLRVDALAQAEYSIGEGATFRIKQQENLLFDVQSDLAVNPDYYRTDLERAQKRSDGYENVIAVKKEINELYQRLERLEQYKQSLIDKGEYAPLKSSAVDSETIGLQLAIKQKEQIYQQRINDRSAQLGQPAIYEDYLFAQDLAVMNSNMEKAETGWNKFVSSLAEKSDQLSRWLDEKTQMDQWGNPKKGHPFYPLDGGLLPGAAYGIPYVPRDNYVMRLHEGERVLTAQEARGYGKNAGGVTVTGNTFTIREEADIDRIAAQLYEKIRLAQMIS